MRKQFPRTITLTLTDRQHRLLCDLVHKSKATSSPALVGEVTQLYDEIVVNGDAFHTSPELCTHPIEFMRRDGRPLSLENNQHRYVEYVCDVCGSKRSDVEDYDGGTISEGQWFPGEQAHG